MIFDTDHFSARLLGGIIQLINIYSLLVFIRVALSWMSIDPYNPVVRFLRGITDPLLDLMRRYMPKALWSSGLDFTPLVLLLLIQLIIVPLLESLAF
ncbi:MAG: YggT family protein [Candidatus Latescibacteria bacterium]|nr:YggT family protein [Candidatus Latescibacterota bacterium]